MKLRLILGAVVLLSILFLPFWLYLPVLAVAMIAIPFYWESLAFAFLIEALYGRSDSNIISLIPLLTLAFLLVLLPAKTWLR